MSEPNPSASLRRIVDGLLNGRDGIYRALRSRVLRYLRNNGSGRAIDHEELADEILAMLFEDIRDHRFHGDSIKALNAYIYAVVRNQFRKALRKNRVLYSPDPPETADTRAENPGVAVEQHELITKLLAELDPQCAELLTLRFRRGWTNQEIADHYGKSKNAVSTAISRCLDKIRESRTFRSLE